VQPVALGLRIDTVKIGVNCLGSDADHLPKRTTRVILPRAWQRRTISAFP
jgi:hypothetical protein